MTDPPHADPSVSLRRLFRHLRQSTLAGNTAALYAAHFAGMLAPLVTIPYLARVLEPEGWGLVVFAQSFAAWLALVLEYGFDLSGTREVARRREDAGELPGVVAGVQGAKALLFVTMTVVVLLVGGVIPIFREHPAFLLWAWAYAVARGFNPFFYFQGRERLKGAAVVEAAAKVLAAIGVFVVVLEPAHGWRVVALQAVTAAGSLAVLTVLMYREIPFRVPGIRSAVETLKEAAGIFAFRSSSGLFIQANSFILGLLTAPQVVAFFGGAERLVRAAVNLLQPITQAIYPRLSHLAETSPDRGTRLLRASFFGITALGLFMGAVAWVGAPLLVRLFFGPGYEAAVPALRVLALLPPVIAVGTVYGIYWALPAGLERPFYALVLAAGLLNVGLALVLAPRFGATGMAACVVTADIVVAAGLVLLHRSRTGSVLPERGDGPASPLTLSEVLE